MTTRLLWTRTLECTTDNGDAEIGLGFALARQGRYDEAIALFQQRWRSNPIRTGACPFRSALGRQHEFDEAENHLRRASPSTRTA